MNDGTTESPRLPRYRPGGRASAGVTGPGHRRISLDGAAVALSGLCLLHCLALPFVIVLLPFLNVLAIERWHAPMLLVVLPISVFALTVGLRRHGNRRVLALGIVGMALMTAGGTFAHYLMGLTTDRILTIAGAIVLAVAHYLNSRLTRHYRGR